MLDVKICKNLSEIPHISKLTVNQLNVLFILKRKGDVTTKDVSEILGYSGNEMTKIMTNLKSSSSKRPAMVFGQRGAEGRGIPKIWSLTSKGEELVEQYLKNII